MKRGLAALAVCLALAPATASAAERSLLVNGDSLAEGTRPYVPSELPGWKVRQSTKVSRHAAEGADVLRRYGRSLARVIHVSLGTNDDPGQTERVPERRRRGHGRRRKRALRGVGQHRPPALPGRELSRVQPRARAVRTSGATTCSC